MIALAEFRRHLDEPGVGAEVLALDIARIGRPDIEPAQHLDELDRLVEYTGRRLSSEPAGRTAATRFLEIVTHDLVFRGNQTDYYDPRNSMLDEVLRRRTGLPIMLCLLCMALGRRLGLQVDGLGFPGHFMACYSDGAGAWLLDPFHDAVIEIENTEVYLARVTRRPVQLAAHFLEPVNAVELAARILNNLRAAYVTHPHAAKLLQVLAFQTVLTPEQAQIWRERAVLHYHMQAWEEAAHDLRRYFYLLGALPYLFPEEARVAYDLPELAPDDQNLLIMHHRISDVLSRVN